MSKGESLKALAVKSLEMNKDVRNFLNQMIDAYERQLNDYVHNTDHIDVQHVARASERVLTIRLIRDTLYHDTNTKNV